MRRLFPSGCYNDSEHPTKPNLFELNKTKNWHEQARPGPMSRAFKTRSRLEIRTSEKGRYRRLDSRVQTIQIVSEGVTVSDFCPKNGNENFPRKRPFISLIFWELFMRHWKSLSISDELKPVNETPHKFERPNCVSPAQVDEPKRWFRAIAPQEYGSVMFLYQENSTNIDQDIRTE